MSMRDSYFSFSTSTPMKRSLGCNFTNNSSSFSSTYQSNRKSRVRENYQNRQPMEASLFASDYDLQTSHIYGENPEMRYQGKFDHTISNRDVEELFNLKKMINFYNFKSKENTSSIKLKEKVLQATKSYIQQKEKDIRLFKQKYEKQRDHYRRSKMRKQQIQKKKNIYLRRNSEDLSRSIQMMRKGNSFGKYRSNQSFTQKKESPKGKKIIEICCPQYIYNPPTPTYYRPPMNFNPPPQPQPSVIYPVRPNDSSLLNASDISYKKSKEQHLSIHCYISETILMKQPEKNDSKKKNQSSLNSSRQYTISLRSCSRSSTKAKKDKGNYIYSKEKRRSIRKSSFLGQNFDVDLSDLLESKKKSDSSTNAKARQIAGSKLGTQQNINSSVINIKVSNAEESSENKSSLVDSFKKNRPINFICSLKKKKDSGQNVGSSGLDELPSSLPKRQGQGESSQKDIKIQQEEELDHSIESLPNKQGHLQSKIVQVNKIAQKEEENNQFSQLRGLFLSHRFYQKKMAEKEKYKEEDNNQIASLPVFQGLLQTQRQEQQVNCENKVDNMEESKQKTNKDLENKSDSREKIENVEENTQCKEILILNATLQSKKAEEESYDELQQIKLCTISKESRYLKTTQQSFSTFRQKEIKQSKKLARSKSYSSQMK